ncbi:two-component sensor histidine kinase [Occultella glacieicola]|uniref:histidine kinase n=1 Tax=Occultella glacieicola TaxID=2518684 RepID=A0ABY2E8M9_9MICO|nr:histidine kinase [Occultella glacieicola]TDE98853.1 two-component sensor histidine kinase [Occultella glacieicola]
MTEPVRARLTTLRPRTTTGRDTVVAGVVALLNVIGFAGLEVLVAGGMAEELGLDVEALSGTPRAVVYALLVAQSAALILRRRAPVLCFGLAVGAQILMAPLLPDLVSFRGLATPVAAYALGAYAPRRTAAVTVAAAAVAEALLNVTLGGPEAIPDGGPVVNLLGSLASALAVYGIACFVGVYIGTRRQLLASLQAQVDAAAAEQQSRAAQAVAAERSRIARELHDVAAHHLSGIVVQAAAAERLIGADPARARESMRWIRTQGRETLDNLRLVVGLLRGEGGAEQTPQPGLADVDDLIDGARAAGARVSARVDGEPWDLGPTAELTLYRVLQEALSNARRHAPGRGIDIRREYTPSACVLTVRNPATPPPPADGRPAATGHGLVGMRERAQMLHGDLSAGPVAGGAWQVQLTIPRPGGTS